MSSYRNLKDKIKDLEGKVTELELEIDNLEWQANCEGQYRKELEDEIVALKNRTLWERIWNN